MTGLTKVLPFQLTITNGNTHVLDDATTKARTASNKVLDYYFNTDKDFDTIREELPNEINLVKNSVQLIADKTHEAIKTTTNTTTTTAPNRKTTSTSRFARTTAKDISSPSKTMGRFASVSAQSLTATKSAGNYKEATNT